MFAVVEATDGLTYDEFAHHEEALRFAQHMNAQWRDVRGPRWVVLHTTKGESHERRDDALRKPHHN